MNLPTFPISRARVDNGTLFIMLMITVKKEEKVNVRVIGGKSPRVIKTIKILLECNIL